MARRIWTRAALCFGGAAWFIFSTELSRGDDAPETQAQLRALQEQNRAMADQLRQQKELIDSLTRKMSEIQATDTQRNRQMEDLSAEVKDGMGEQKSPGGSTFGNLRISGEGGVAFFESGSQGMYPHSEFRIDEARLFLETPIVDQVYFYGELNLATREEQDVEFRLGEAYLDFENVSRLWKMDHLLSVRFGRMYIPFGEEYETRYAIDNPLISHSLSDLWGVDEGIELYGKAGKFTYATAVQNGGIPDTTDFDSDKSVAGRVGYDPTPWLHLSVSGMRTGDLTVSGDMMSAMWFGNGFFRSLGSPATTKFHANAVEGDVGLSFRKGYLKAYGGYINYDDNDPAGDNARDVYYYAVEGVYNIAPKFYAAARFSQIFANNGFPIVANGTFGAYFFGALTEQIWRLSLGTGYRFSPNLIFKGEYSFEHGEVVGGASREHEDLFALEAAFRF